MTEYEATKSAFATISIMESVNTEDARHAMLVRDFYLDKFGYERATVQACTLHDEIEDGRQTAQSLLDAGVHPNVVDIVVIVSRVKGETYNEYIQRVIESRNLRAMRVKLSDVIVNDARRPRKGDLAKRYARAKSELWLALDDVEGGS